jgi:hypothetical protein
VKNVNIHSGGGAMLKVRIRSHAELEALLFICTGLLITWNVVSLVFDVSEGRLRRLYALLSVC